MIYSSQITNAQSILERFRFMLFHIITLRENPTSIAIIFSTHSEIKLGHNIMFLHTRTSISITFCKLSHIEISEICTDEVSRESLYCVYLYTAKTLLMRLYENILLYVI